MKLPDLEAFTSNLSEVVDELQSAAVECVEAGLEIQRAEMTKGLERHRDSGAAADAEKQIRMLQEGNIVEGAVGLRFPDDEGYFHALYQEYGSPTFDKDPWLRPAVDGTKGRIRKRWKEILAKRLGVTTK